MILDFSHFAFLTDLYFVRADVLAQGRHALTFAMFVVAPYFCPQIMTHSSFLSTSFPFVVTFSGINRMPLVAETKMSSTEDAPR